MIGQSLLAAIWNTLQKKKRTRYLANLVSRGLRLGANVHIVDTFFFDPSHCFLISIGDNCTICPNVRLIAHDASTKGFLGYSKMGVIDIGANCFIGDSTIVLPGVRIGPNAIVGAGSVVTKDVPEGALAAGNPAKCIGTVADYCRKISTMAERSRIFGAEYYIEHLTEKTRTEILDTIVNGIGFIV